jgi:hypothetical protein
MNHVDLVVAAVGMLITVASVVLGAWVGLRPGRRGNESREKARDSR